MKKGVLILIICLIILFITSLIIGIIYRDKFFGNSSEESNNSPLQQDWTGYTNLHDATDKAISDFLDKS